MARLSLLLLTWALSLTSTFAQSACTGQQYNTLPGFPASNSGCYPVNYMSTSDLGNTNPSDAQSRCQQQCNNLGTSCGSVVAQVNKAADSNLYSGTCFYFAPGSTPISPRSCANTAYLLLGYVKDSTLQCFSSSSAAANTFCQSLLRYTVTFTVSTIPSTRTFTSTNTATATTFTTTSATSTIFATSTMTATATFTTSITVATNTVSSNTTAVNTVTQTVTVSSTTTLTVTGQASVAGRSKRRRIVATSAPPPACVTSGTPNTRLSAACSCFRPVPARTTKTVTAMAPSTTVTTTTTLTSTAPVTSMTTITVTSSTITVTTSTTTTLSLTATATAIITQSATSTVTTTTTVVSTSTFLPLQTLVLTVHNSHDPSLASTGGIGYASLSAFDPGQGYNSYLIDFTTDSTSTQKFLFDPNSGQLTALNGPASAVGNPLTFYDFQDSGSYVLVSDTASAIDLSDYPMICQIVSGQLQCQYQPLASRGVFLTCSGSLVIGDPSGNVANYCPTGYPVDVFAAIVG